MAEIAEHLLEWEELSNEYKNLEVTCFRLELQRKFWTSDCENSLQNVNKSYLELLEGLEELQSKCMKDISHQRYRITQISKKLRWVGHATFHFA